MATTTESFPLQVSELFDVLIDPDTYPRWLVGAQHIRAVSDDWPQPESYFEHTVGFGPLVIPDKTTLRAIEPPYMLELLVRARPFIEATVRFEIEATATGCTLVMEETPAGVFKIISAIAQPLIAARNRRSLDRLKALVE